MDKFQNAEARRSAQLALYVTSSELGMVAFTLAMFATLFGLFVRAKSGTVIRVESLRKLCLGVCPFFQKLRASLSGCFVVGFSFKGLYEL